MQEGALVSRAIRSAVWAVALIVTTVLWGCATVPGGSQGPAMRLARVMSDVYVASMLERLFTAGDPRDTARFLVERQSDKMQRVEQMLGGRYAAAFTEPELAELVAFFDSPLGRKVQGTYSSVFYGTLAEAGRPAEVQKRMGQRLAARFKATFTVAELKQVNRFYSSPLGKKWRAKGQEIDRDLFADEDIRVLRQVAVLECMVDTLTPEVRRQRAQGANPEASVAAILGQRSALIDGTSEACHCVVGKLSGKMDVKGMWRISPSKRAKQRAQIVASGACPAPTGVRASAGPALGGD
jgi:hypothetical protein